ncbi:MAG: LysE family transporter [Rubrivivax sp.]|nr:LysE family transporter [Rubrivivax sp.]
MGANAWLFVQAMLVGLAIAAPVGPIAVLAIQRTLQQGLGIGLATGLGAAVADGLHGAVGAFGAQALTRTLQAAQGPLALVSAAVLGWLAWRTWRQPSAPAAATRPAAAGAARWSAAFASSLVLTLANPATIVSFAAVFALLAAASAVPASPLLMLAGVFSGSALWWLLLAGVVARLRRHLDLRWRRRINRASALLLGGFALAALAAVALAPRAVPGAG